MTPLIQLRSTTLRFRGVSIENPYAIDIPQGVTAIIGPNGAGKTSLGAIIESGWNFMTNDISSPLGRLSIKTIEFSDIHSLAGFKAEYYQQRFESGINDEVPTVAEMLGESIHSERWQEIAAALGISYILQKRLNHLSSGELRKMLIANMMRELPKLLILDNPYIGLDADSRVVLDDTLAAIASSGTSVILLIGNHLDIPECAVAAIPVRDMAIGQIAMRGDQSLRDFQQSFAYLFDYTPLVDLLPLRSKAPDADSEHMVEMRDCEVKYGKRTIIDHIDWQVMRGEKWLLSGPNGSGKSTLLSLVNADNPQSYSNDISLFGRKRGSGESIWDIKRRIGYVSPEMHLYFKAGNNTAAEVIAGGLSDTLGCFRRIPQADMDQALLWIKILRLDDMAQTPFTRLSFGQQRLVLLARALIKNPELLILDEPLHGLDHARKQGALAVINAMAAQPGTTLLFVTHYADERPQGINHTLKLSPKSRS